jgi:hypothetical protein
MTRFNRFGLVVSVASTFFLVLASPAQHKPQNVSPRNQAYDLSRETSLQGTVVGYTAASPTPPLGARVTLQTASGPVDVHLGDARLLEADHFTLAVGESIHILGENVSLRTSTQFVARVIQKGNQSLVLRSPRGFPLVPMVKGAGKAANSQAGVL